jgi:hypothetical protein
MTDYAALARELNRRILENPERRLLIIKEFYVELLAAGDPDGADFVLTLRSITMTDSQPPKWLVPTGVGFGLLTLIFLMAIVLLNIAGHEVSPGGRFALVGTMAFGAAFSAAAWIGSATLSGDVSQGSTKPLILSASGGFAMFVLVFFLGYWFYIK